MPTPPDPYHAAALAEVVRRLKADPGVRALAGDRIGESPDGLPCVVVRVGRSYGPEPPPRKPAQRDVRVESRAADPGALGRLAVAVQAALVGHRSDAFEHCVLSDTGPEEAGDGYVSRRDVFACIVVGRQQPPVSAAPPAPPVAPAAAEADRPTRPTRPK